MLIRLAPLAFVAAAALYGATPIRLHPSNSHYFEYRGKPLVLITSGEHYGSVLNLRFNYVAYLDELKRNGFNLTRTFTGTYREEGTSGHGASPLTPGRGKQEFISPWAWSGGTGGFEGATFDLDRWNPAYFERLRAFCKAAETRGVIVELVLFSRMYDDTRWRSSPMHPDNNLQGAQWREVKAERFLTGDNLELLKRQKAVTRKIVTELKDVPNVYFEIANEPAHRAAGSEYARATHDWHEAIASEIVAAEARLPLSNRHLIAYNSDYSPSAGMGPVPKGVSIVNFHYLPRLRPALAAYGQDNPLGYDETRWIAHNRYPDYRNTMTTAAGRIEAWEFLVGGGSIYSNLNHAYQVDDPAGRRPESDEFKAYLRHLKTFLDGFDLPKMRRDTMVAASGAMAADHHLSAISEPGKQYAIYLHHSTYAAEGRSYQADERQRRAALELSLPAGKYTAEWIYPADGRVVGSESIAHTGGTVRLAASPEYKTDIALRIRSAGTSAKSPR